MLGTTEAVPAGMATLWLNDYRSFPITFRETSRTAPFLTGLLYQAGCTSENSKGLLEGPPPCPLMLDLDQLSASCHSG